MLKAGMKPDPVHTKRLFGRVFLPIVGPAGQIYLYCFIIHTHVLHPAVPSPHTPGSFSSRQGELSHPSQRLLNPCLVKHQQHIRSAPGQKKLLGMPTGCPTAGGRSPPSTALAASEAPSEHCSRAARPSAGVRDPCKPAGHPQQGQSHRQELASGLRQGRTLVLATRQLLRRSPQFVQELERSLSRPTLLCTLLGAFTVSMFRTATSSKGSRGNTHTEHARNPHLIVSLPFPFPSSS